MAPEPAGADADAVLDQIRTLARERLGYDDLRLDQEEALRAVLERDTFVVMPTGAGKSAIYQLAAAVSDGLCLVVSPTIALQHDQVRSLEDLDLGAAALLNSTLPARARRDALAQAADDRLRFLFLAPEQLANASVLDVLRQAQPSLVVVDEAHCVSPWGHDFRPDYLRLRWVLRGFGSPRLLALTATASPPVREEVVDRLGMRDPAVVVHDLERENFRYVVRLAARASDKARMLAEELGSAGAPAIVYVARRKDCDVAAEAVRAAGLSAATYHGGAGRATSARRRRTPSWPATWTSWSPPARSAWVSTTRPCAESCTGTSATRSTVTTRRPAAPGGTADPRAPGMGRRHRGSFREGQDGGALRVRRLQGTVGPAGGAGGPAQCCRRLTRPCGTPFCAL